MGDAGVSKDQMMEPERRLVRALLCSLCPVNVTQIVHMSQTLAAQRRVQEERQRAMFSHQAEEIVYPKLTEGSEQDDGPKPIDRNEEFLRLMMEQMDDEALETD